MCELVDDKAGGFFCEECGEFVDEPCEEEDGDDY
jgi:hypothetical protein